MSDPSGWLVKSKHGFVRAMWHGKPSEEMLEIARHDGDEVIPLYTAEGLQQAQQDAKRYRWLRDVGDSTWNPISTRGITAKECDAAIDCAMAAGGVR